MGLQTVANLVREARLGSDEARDELVRRHFREAAVLAAAVVNDPTEAQDLAQEAFIRAFRNLDLLADPGRFPAWLRRIVVGVSIDWLRSFRPSLYRGWSEADGTVLSSGDPLPLDLVLRSEVVERVGSALAALPPRYRVPLRLYHLDGLSHAKIAAALDVPVGTVRSLVARARAKLRPLLAEYAPAVSPDANEVFEEAPMTAPERARFLHVANGSATTKTIEAAGIPGIMSIWADPLHDGPVPGELNDEDLLALRLRFLGPPLDPESRLQQWRLTTQSSGTYDELILWFEHDLFDQLNLIQVLTWISDHVPTTTPVSLICIGSFPGHPDFKGLGELTPDELASLLETREPVGVRHYEAARQAWCAFRAPTPEALDALRQRDMPDLPYLGAAISRFLQEYPWTRDGLSRTERRLLQLAQEEEISLRRAFPRMHEGEQAYYLTDTSLTELAEALSRTTPPLATLRVPEGVEDRVLAGTIALTEAGRSVLAGEMDRVATCGIDRWFGGVHLQTGQSLWRWDDGQRRVVS